MYPYEEHIFYNLYNGKIENDETTMDDTRLRPMVLLFSSCGDTKIKHDSKNELRPPAYPLVTIDPYTSGWAFSDCLYDAPVKHWTGKRFSFDRCGKSRRTGLSLYGC